jgi:uncharacterized protein
MARRRSAVGAAARRLRLLVLQPTPFCNIDCSYCYLANRRSAARMTLDTVALVCQRVFESPFLDRRLTVAWHGGEPLAVPIPWYQDAIALMDESRPSGLELTHRFQTNGLLLTDDWARFFARTGARIGLSIDGPADLHDANRRTRRGLGTHDAVMRAVRLLQDHGLDFHVITVLTERSLEEPDRLFDFYVQNGIQEVGFNIEEIEGKHTTSCFKNEGAEEKFRHFIKRFFELAWQSPELLKLRELEGTLAHLLSDEPVWDEQNQPFAVLSISHDGAISTFSPELLDARHSRFGTFAFGHIATDRLVDIEQVPPFQRVRDEIRRGVERCERNCRYFQWCGGGAPANKLFEAGRFDASETMHCRMTRQIVIDEAIVGLESRLTSRPTPIEHQESIPCLNNIL